MYYNTIKVPVPNTGTQLSVTSPLPVFPLIKIVLYRYLDTIPGRQSMASLFYLLRQFDDVLIYLNSIKV